MLAISAENGYTDGGINEEEAQYAAAAMIQRLMNNISTVIVGKQEVIEYALIALLCRGHVLIEDVPGVGKTTLASALAKSLDCTFRRIQFTPT